MEEETKPPVPEAPPASETATEQPPAPVILTDPRTGKPLRDQNPGVPDSKWVGKHGVNDVDDVLNLKKAQENPNIQE